MIKIPDQQQQAQPEKPKFSLFKPSEWPEFIRNFWNRKAPVIKRFRFGRRKVGERLPPLFYEIRDRWLNLSDRMYGVLETIEGTWGTEGRLLGFAPKQNILADPKGIVTLYKDLGVYSDIDRIPSEATWFNVGTDFVEEFYPFEIPNKAEWDRYAWKKDDVEALSKSPAQPWRITRVKRIRLGTGVVYHEGKINQKEELHCFGFNNVLALGNMILQYGDMISKEFLQRKGAPVEIRTNFDQTVAVMHTLFDKIAKIEQENFSNLSKLQAAMGRYNELWEELVAKNTPEGKNIIIRFPHTFRVIKTYLLESIKEMVKKLDDNGNIYEVEVTSYKPLYFDPEKNPYTKELAEVQNQILNLGDESVVRNDITKLKTELEARNDKLNELELQIKDKRSKAIAILREYLLKRLGKLPSDKITNIEDSLAALENSTIEEFKLKNDSLFDLLEKVLSESKIKKDRIKKFVDSLKKSFNEIISHPKIQKLQTDLLATLENIIKTRSEWEKRVKLIFRKEQLELYLRELTPINPKFKKRDEEIEYGLDENGYPLEIDPKENGIVLIDKWWNELAQNKWQLTTIAKKPGGVELLKTHLGLDVKLIGPIGDIKEVQFLNLRSPDEMRPIRYVDDKRFWGHLDLLEAGHIIFSYWDAVRDDFRDGRFHKHSKSVGDYVIEGMGGFDEELAAPYFKGWGLSRKIGSFFTRRGNFPLGRVNINVDVADKNVQINAKPEDFENTNIIPKDEAAVTRDYIMRLTKVPPGDLPKDVIKKGDSYFIQGTRRPTKYNPGFDRRAENLKYIHWGNMYYYRWISGANEWSENPFPHISTRGIALYLAYLAATDVYHYEDAVRVLKGHKMDYGVRGQGKHGVVNPLDGEGILQED